MRRIKASFAPIAAGSRNISILRGTSGGWKRSGLACAGPLRDGRGAHDCKTYIKSRSCRVRDPRVPKLNRFCNVVMPDIRNVSERDSINTATSVSAPRISAILISDTRNNGTRQCSRLIELAHRFTMKSKLMLLE